MAGGSILQDSSQKFRLSILLPAWTFQEKRVSLFTDIQDNRGNDIKNEMEAYYEKTVMSYYHS